jgi:hypothetical protein
VVVISWLRTGAKILAAVAAVVTPLGLYQDVVPQSPESAQFHYIKDKSLFGEATPPRDANFRFSRTCGGWAPVACPNSYANITTTGNDTTWTVIGDWYDTHVPQYVIDSLQSGLSLMEPSVSSIFDIQSRYLTWSQLDQGGHMVPVDNNSARPVSLFRPISSLIAEGDIQLAEGLVIDLQEGGIGFRNHSAPPWQPYGSKWTEDLLFVQPETQCVDLNITIDYDVAEGYSNGEGGYQNLVLTDRGGFAHLPADFSPLDWTIIGSQQNPELFERAYTGAWVNNFVSMIFLNVTIPGNHTKPGTAFRYLNSSVGKTFPLQRKGTTTWSFPFASIPNLAITASYGDYLQDTDIPYTGVNMNGTNYTDLGTLPDSQPALHQNPFHISHNNFTSAGGAHSAKIIAI